MNLLLWILVAYGVSTVITQGSITWKLRNAVSQISGYLGQWINCPMCFGFWVGVLLSYTYSSPTGQPWYDGFLASGTTWIIHTLVTSVSNITSSLLHGMMGERKP